jgi:hypothetical protein
VDTNIYTIVPTFRKNGKFPFAKNTLCKSNQRGKTPEKFMDEVELPDLIFL